jgi:hypothetical protein
MNRISISILTTLLLVLFLYAQGDSSCVHEHTPIKSMCTGCPPKYNGKLCASTTRYNDLTKGACGCGSEPNPTSFWTKSGYTAAGNAMMMDPNNPQNGWCPSKCGLCFKLCSTGGSTTGKSTTAGVCRVFQLENRCGDGYKQPTQAQWCRQELSPWECNSNPSACQKSKSTNDYGYPAHFDLQDANKQISSGLGWDNVEVTFEQVDCSTGNFGNWEKDCYCKRALNSTLN